MKASLLSLVFIVFGITAHSQLRIVGVAQSEKSGQKKNFNTRTSAGILNLPIWEDFSTSNQIPNADLWVNSENVQISNGLGSNLPSTNIATFDGLDVNGNPYSTDASDVDFTDSLTSLPVDLSIVPIAERNTVYLSFFYQKKGKGEIPDDEDFISLDFLAADSTWVRIWPSDPSFLEPNTDIFTRVMIPVVDSMFHNAFQFRFRSFGRRNGPFDTWNIDYIYFDKGRSFNNFDFLDRAITGEPSKIFRNYTAIPLRQLFANPGQITDSSFIQLINYETSQPVQGIEYSALLVNSISGNLIESLVDKKALVIQSLQKLMLDAPKIDVQNLLNQTTGPDDSLYVDLLYFVDTGDTLLIDAIDPGTGDTTYIASIDLRVNDTISRSFIFDDFYAYDDGTAEFGAGINQTNGQLAYQFFIDEIDTIVSLDMYFPNIGTASAGLPIEVFILSNLDGSDESELFRRSFTVQASGINEFRKYQIIPPVVVSDSIFIGYRQTSDDFIPLGLDKNNDSGDNIYFNVSGTWEKNVDVIGSLMLRPRFGSGDLITSLDTGTIPENVNIYPNPVSHMLKINGPYESIRVYNLTGRQVLALYFGENRKELDFSILPNGLYLIEIKNKDRIQIEKIIKL